MPNLKGSEWLIIILLIVLLFGAKRLPDAARGLGRSLRIFKAETKGLTSEGATPPLPPVVPPASPVADPIVPPAEQLPTVLPAANPVPAPGAGAPPGPAAARPGVSAPTVSRRRRRRAAAGPDGSMPLVDHLRELRRRLVISLLAIAVGMTIGWIWYEPIFALIRAPFDDVVAQAQAAGRDVTLAFTGVVDPFVMKLKVAGMVGVVLASPVWLYQLWRFITPGLHRNERRWAMAFVAVATPLFLFGVALAYVFLPRGLGILLGFTPESIENIISVDRYLSFFLRMLLVFGIGFLVPLVVVALNMVGILPAARLRASWRWIVMGVVLFAAIATPTGDPFNLALLAVPLLVLMGLAGLVCALNDRRRARRAATEPQWGDDETSDLDV